MNIRILIADDHPSLREGLRSLVDQELDMQVVGEASNGKMAVSLACNLCPDVVVMDIGLPDINGLEATRELLSQLPGTKVIALSMHADKRFVSGMIKAGASGYLLKDYACEELVEAIRTVVKNRNYLSSILSRKSPWFQDSQYAHAGLHAAAH